MALLLCLQACKKSNDISPLPPSLQTMISETEDCSCQPYLSLYEWKGRRVYLKGFTGPACNWVPAYYDEHGQPLMMIATYTLDQFLAESKLVKLIWECR